MLLLYLKTMLRQLLLPPASPVLLAFAGWLLLQRRPALGRALILVGLVSLWLLATPLVALALTRLAQHYPALDPSQLAGAQAIVILGGGGQRAWAPEYRAPAAGAELMEKLAYGAFLSRHANLPILVTGRGIEADAMRATLRQNFDITPRWVDAQAYDTFENARNSAVILRAAGVQRIVLVTRATHMRRSMQEFLATGLTVTAAPVATRLSLEPGDPLRYLPSGDALRLSYEACYELIGEPVRRLLAATHLRRQQSTTTGSGSTDVPASAD
jgi:uncharacterized SAM-binding protein YcdF (DUF218 family)